MLTRTTTQILESLRNPGNRELWRVFDARYRPVLEAFAQRHGLDQDEAAEVAQTALAQFAQDYAAGRYDRGKGRLSSWIIGIAHNRVRDALRLRERRAAARGETVLASIPDEGAAGRHWEEAVEKVVLERALHALRTTTRFDERTLRAFDLCAIRGVPAEAVAAECGMSVAEVYVAKNRAIKKLREIVADFTREYDDE